MAHFFFFLGSFPLSVVFVFGYLFEDLICKNLSINDKWSFVPLSVVFIFGYLFEDSICKNQSECCVDVKIEVLFSINDKWNLRI